MGIKVKVTSDVKSLNKAFAELKALNGRKVNVGIPAGSKRSADCGNTRMGSCHNRYG